MKTKEIYNSKLICLSLDQAFLFGKSYAITKTLSQEVMLHINTNSNHIDANSYDYYFCFFQFIFFCMQGLACF